MDPYVAKVVEKMKDKSAFPRANAVSMGASLPLSLLIFKRYDADEDGELSIPEFKQFLKDKGYFIAETNFQAALARIDSDGNGVITYDEFKNFWVDQDKHAHMMLNAKQKEQVESLFKCFDHFDASKDGLLDQGEFKNLIKLMKKQGFNINDKPTKIFKEIDISGDGNVSFSELLRYFIEKYGILEVE